MSHRPGAATRLSLPFDDPKVFDNTAQEPRKYDERCEQIARELLFVFSCLITKTEAPANFSQGMASRMRQCYHAPELRICHRPAARYRDRTASSDSQLEGFEKPNQRCSASGVPNR